MKSPKPKYCTLVRAQTEWICSHCGRRLKIDDTKDMQFHPTAVCRIPQDYNSEIKRSVKQNGFGLCLSKIIKKLGVTYEPISTTGAYIKFLDTKSKKWCKENADQILQLMKVESALYRIPYSENIFKAVIRLAISRMN